MEDYDLAQVGGEFTDEVVEAIVNLIALGEVIEVRSSQWRTRGEDFLWRRVGLSYIAPHLASDGGPGISGEGGATVGVEALSGVPKADATGLKEFRVRK